jgi:putative transposase
MPGPYSLDLRQRVVAACDEGKLTRNEISDLYEVGESAIYEWLQRRRTTGSIAPKPHTGGAASSTRRCCASWWRRRTTGPWRNTPLDMPSVQAASTASLRSVAG